MNGALYAGVVIENDRQVTSAASGELCSTGQPRRLSPRVLGLGRHEMMLEHLRADSHMERPIDEIKRAEAAMQELLKAAMELRRQIDLACAQNPEETAELTKAAGALEKEVQRIKDYLQQLRQSIQ